MGKPCLHFRGYYFDSNIFETGQKVAFVISRSNLNIVVKTKSYGPNMKKNLVYILEATVSVQFYWRLVRKVIIMM
jgi:hypothetical protein